jgi:hypothetical protein
MRDEETDTHQVTDNTGTGGIHRKGDSNLLTDNNRYN